MLFNTFGVGTYLGINHWICAPRIQEENLGGIGQVYYWTTTEFPLLALCLGANVTGLLMSKDHAYFWNRQMTMWQLVFLVWGLVLVCDPLVFKTLLVVSGTL